MESKKLYLDIFYTVYISKPAFTIFTLLLLIIQSFFFFVFVNEPVWTFWDVGDESASKQCKNKKQINK